MKKDNAGIKEKLTLRRRALSLVVGPLLVVEAYAGNGAIFSELYHDQETGIALEKDEVKAKHLALQRPAWRVYECDSVGAADAGLLADEPATLIDIDPYGDPWPFISAYLARRRAPGTFVLAVNDGLRRGIKLGVAANYPSVRDAVLEFGADLWDVYLEACRRLLEIKAEQAGCRLLCFEGFYAGFARQMTHYYAVLEMPRRVAGIA